ncbi:hypothetical protein ID866_5867 [Astraeus odoratus]|nr:hypothetical protein ID866_5867 [Astraeus odoratus]
MASVSTIQSPVIPQVQRSSTEPEEKDAQFLALRLLNKRARVRLSADPIDLSFFPGKVSLFAVTNTKGWFAAVTFGATLILSPLSSLRSAFQSASTEDDKPFEPQRRVPLSSVKPIIITFACNESKLLVGLSDGTILVYDTDQLFSSGDGHLSPVHTFPVSSPAAPLSIQPNPEGVPELVAVLRDLSSSPGSPAVELLDVQKMVSSGGWMAGGSPNTTPVAISWSPKGKQLALGMQSGDIVTYNPADTATPKFSIPHPPSANGLSVISIQWLSTSSFHAIYAPPGQLTPDTEQLHFHVTLDAKSNSAQDIKFNSPYLPFPGLRPPGSFAVALKNWDPYRTLLFLGDSTSSDIGVIGAIADGARESWHNLSLEETSTPSLPLDKDQNDTIMIGLDLDVTNTESYRHTTASGEPLELPSPPVMYAYASDGTVIGWYLLNTSGTVYRGMAKEASISLELPVASNMTREPSSDMHITPSVSPLAPVGDAGSFGQMTPAATQSTAPASSQNVFGAQSLFGSPSATSLFGKPSTFGQTSFGQPTATGSSAFGQGPAFGSAAPTAGGFGTFSSTGPAKFGQSTFGFGFASAEQPVASQSTAASQPVDSTREDSMAEDGPSLDGLGLGSSNAQDADSKPSIFGSAATQAPSAFQSSGSGLIKSGTGFGTSLDQKSPFANPSGFASGSSTSFSGGAFSSQSTQSPAFGQPGFGQPKPALGQSSFGQPSFGQPAFGQSTFGQPTFGQTLGQTQSAGSVFGKSSFGTTTTPTAAASPLASGGGFGSFASSSPGGFAAFANKDSLAAKPVWASAEPAKTQDEQPKSVFGPSGTSVFSKPTETSTKTESVFIKKESEQPAPPSSFAARETAMREPESRSPSPVAAEQPPTPTATTAESKATTGGAFGNLTSTPSAFKPATGFFGEMPKDSPFFAPKQTDSKPVSAFSLSTPKDSSFFTPKQTDPKPVSAATPATPTTTPPKSSTTTPLFGSSSMPGTVPKAFGAATSSPTTTPAVPTTGAFSSFAGTGGFGSFAGSGAKSFADLLRSGGESPSEPTKSKASVFDTPDKGGEPFKDQSKSKAPVFGVSHIDAQLTSRPTSSATPLSTPVKIPHTPEVPGLISPGEGPTKTTDESKPDSGKDKASEAPQVKEPSFETISSSTSSSFVNVDVSAEEGEVVEETVGEEAESEDETRSFLSDLPSDSEESSKVTEDESDQGSEVEDEETQPTNDTLLPKSATTRSPSTTPKAELPKIALSTSPPPSPPLHAPSPSGSVPRISPVRELSTTPPGSPVREGERATVPAPVTRSSPPPGSPFSLAPRINSSNRPVRSSPLASAPLVGDIEPPVSVTPPPPSKSAPPTVAAGPPKVPIEQWSAPTKKEELQPAPSSFPKTPLLSTTVPEPAAITSPLIAPIPTSSPPIPGPSGKSFAPFSFPSTLPPFTPSSPTPSLFGTPAKLGGFTPPPSKPTSPAPFTLPPNSFGMPSLSLGTTPASSSASAFTPPVTAPSVVAPVSTPAKPEQGMQAECANLLSALTKELENLRMLATAASRQTAELKKTSGVMHSKADLGDPHKWAFGDMKEYGRILTGVQHDIRELKQQRVTLRKSLRELDSSMLKALTRKEEIIRFNKARTDTEFAKMLKVRTLGPEYIEIQSQLRRDIRAVRDRVQKLEDHLQASKKRLQEFKTGKPSFRPPSLDTINRTLRNIDIAICQQQQDMKDLRKRISRLDIASARSVRDDRRRLGGSQTKRPLNVTPNVAVTTAAALNAERSAQKLKRVLLATRDTPLLNSKAAATPIPTSFQTPQKFSVIKPEPETPAATLALPATPTMSFPSSFPMWSPSSPCDVGDSPSQSISLSRHRGGTKHHQKPITLKKTANPDAPARVAAPSFEWGPVQPIRPMTTLAFDLRQKAFK